ncbi:MAG: DNA polymerase III subunit delta [Bacteroidales bacterium]|nr:DNA polymerase III subunit delta [Bacteroidales bacterium]MBN2757509.1 DNA polymerase III subunit delta [Bacteroidales bacterium]
MMTFDQIINDLKKKDYKAIYFLMGEESFYIDQITNYIANNVLSESEKAFNQIIVYGKDADALKIDNLAKRYPMMTKYQVVIVKEAQHIKNIDQLSFYASKPLNSTILVLNYKYKTLDKRKKLYKEIEKNGLIFESKKLYENQVPAWINSYLSKKKYNIDPIASALLTEFLGTNLSKIANELDKLIISLPENTVIKTSHIEENIGISKDYNNFELQNALIAKDILKANRIIDHFGKNQKENPIVLTINSLFFFFKKVLIYHFTKDKSSRSIASVLQINPFFVKDYQMAAKKYNTKKVVDIISYLREYDLKSKGLGNISAAPEDLLRELIFKILH